MDLWNQKMDLDNQVSIFSDHSTISITNSLQIPNPKSEAVPNNPYYPHNHHTH